LEQKYDWNISVDLGLMIIVVSWILMEFHGFSLIFPYSGNFIIPTVTHIFQSRSTTNQMKDEHLNWE
jgi:hypothetical protein